MAKRDVLPPLPLLEQWRAEGLSPEQIRTRCDEFFATNPGLSQRRIARVRFLGQEMIEVRSTAAYPSKLPPDAELMELAETMTYKELAARFGVTEAAVSRRFRGLPVRPLKPPSPTQTRLAQLDKEAVYQDCLSRGVSAVAKELHVSIPSLRGWLGRAVPDRRRSR